MKHQTRVLRCLAGILFLMVASTGVLRAADPQPLVVWTATPWQALTVDMQPPADPSLALKLVAARGGIASGLVVVSGAPGAVVAKAEDLKNAAGGTIPVRLRYATRKRDLGPAAGFVIAGEQLDTSVQLGQSRLLDALSDTPVAGEPTQPIWVTVDVPADAQPGAYQGTIKVQDKDVSVALSVADFTVPPKGERLLYVGAHQSPDSVAFRYGVTPWSAEHFKLLEPSLDLAGR
ncbi:MAG: glycoside hydrolase domain-containing protein, partial [bacterium]